PSKNLVAQVFHEKIQALKVFAWKPVVCRFWAAIPCSPSGVPIAGTPFFLGRTEPGQVSGAGQRRWLWC
ncbi:MAG TPA: hypothetical protein VJU59_48640, partial [Paraburkholderia sp.]|uniref:hypothetical protein n=1 Tax=Paraburkholderia sp. TaxID=1926495 RepID=UPI002B46942C